MTASNGDRSRIVIVGAGISGLMVAALLADVPADVLVLEQVLPPGRKREFPGIVSDADFDATGIAPVLPAARLVAQVEHVDLDGEGATITRRPQGWRAVEHGELLDALRSMLQVRGVTIVPRATVSGFRYDAGVVSGVTCDDGQSFAADLVVLADECSPRLAEGLGLRPDWSPFDLMHVAKRRYEAGPDVIQERFGLGVRGHRVVTFAQTASWGSPGWGMLIPGQDAITVAVTMSLEEAMVSSRHISEYLDEVEQRSPVRGCLDGLALDAYVTEVVPSGGFDTRNGFHADGLIVANDLVGVTHPLNRDGLSANLVVCHAAARTIARAVATNDFRSLSLRSYSASIAADVIPPVDAARRTDRSLRARPPWLWAARADLFPTHQGVTAGAKSETLFGKSDTGFRQRLRGWGRFTGGRRHAPGEHDD